MDKPSLIDRFKLTWDFWQRGSRYMTKQRGIQRAPMSIFTWADVGAKREEKAAPFTWPEWRLGKPQWMSFNYQAYAQEGFNENAIVYSAIMYKVRSITIAPLRAYKGTVDEPELLPADDPLQNLVARPNPYMSWSEFQGLAEVYFNLAGNVYVYVEPADDGGPVPKALWLLRPDLVYIVPHPDFGKRKFLEWHPAHSDDKPVEKKELELDSEKARVKIKEGIKALPNTEKVVGFLYVPEGKPQSQGVGYLPEQVIHIKLPNPLDPLDGMGYGLPSLSPGARSADVDNAFTKYLKLFVDKGAIPPGLLTFDVPLDDKDVARARERFMEIYGGVDNWSDVAVLDQGGDYKRLSLNFDEMGFERIDGRNESRIVAPFGVPLTLIESRPDLTQATYNNKESDRVMFWQDTMTPELRWFEVEYQYHLQGDSGEFVMFDLSKVPALMPTPAQRVEWATEAFGRGGITRNEYRSVIGFNPIDDGDMYVMPMTLIESPVGSFEEEEEKPPDDETQEGMPEATEEAEDKAAKQGSMSAEQKAAFWKVMDAQARSWEKRFGDAAERAFKNDLREILAIVSAGKAKALEDKSTVSWSLVLLAVTDYLAMAGDNWREEFAPVISGLIVDRGEQLNIEFGMQFDVRNLLAEQWYEDYTLTFAQPILDTTEEQLSAMFQQAMSEGWSVPQMQRNLETIFQQWMDGDLTAEMFEWFEQRMPAYRREMIARTETIRASNAGSEALYRNWGVQMKEWYSTPDARTRDAHQIGAAWGDAPLIVPINQPFDVGGESLMYPGDPGGSPENTINCRCTVLPVI